MSPFEVLNNITAERENKWEDIGESNYNAFMINRGLSYHMDCIMYASEMNRYSDLPLQMQYDFLRTVIEPKKKRYAKWSNSKKDEDIQLVSEFYDVSPKKAVEYHALLTPEEIETIREKMTKGGSSKSKK
jgi:hypothetical protein